MLLLHQFPWKEWSIFTLKFSCPLSLKIIPARLSSSQLIENVVLSATSSPGLPRWLSRTRSEEKARDAPGSSALRLQGAERGRPGKKERVSNPIRWPTLSAAGPLSQLPRLGPPFYRRPTNPGFRTSSERNCGGVGARPGAEEGGSRKKGLFPGPCVLLGALLGPRVGVP